MINIKDFLNKKIKTIILGYESSYVSEEIIGRVSRV
jgi:hypothetical protein